MISLIFTSPVFFLLWIAAVVFALSVHEFSHALAAHALGDDTALRKGRLTLNPMSHIDPLGFLMLIFAGFGWGKPVPFNPYNLRYPRWGPALVAAGGPAANLASVLVFGFALRALHQAGFPDQNLLVIFLTLLVLINGVLFLFNLIPIPPLDGSKALFAALAAPQYDRFRASLETRGPIILLALIILDRLLPVSLLGTVFSSVFNLLGRYFGAAL